MISKASDYRFIYGDLDRIVIDGKIMPLRTGNTDKVDKNGNPIPKANILRGEDIAFIMEACCQRYYAGYNIWEVATSQRYVDQSERLFFSRNITTRENVNLAISLLKSAFWESDEETSGNIWLKSILQSNLMPRLRYSTNRVGANQISQHFRLTYPEVDHLTASDSISVARFNRGDQLNRQKISDLFTDLRRFMYFLYAVSFYPKNSTSPSAVRENFLYEKLGDRTSVASHITQATPGSGAYRFCGAGMRAIIMIYFEYQKNDGDAEKYGAFFYPAAKEVFYDSAPILAALEEALGFSLDSLYRAEVDVGSILVEAQLIDDTRWYY